MVFPATPRVPLKVELFVTLKEFKVAKPDDERVDCVVFPLTIRVPPTVAFRVTPRTPLTVALFVTLREFKVATPDDESVESEVFPVTPRVPVTLALLKVVAPVTPRVPLKVELFVTLKEFKVANPDVEREVAWTAANWERPLA